MARPLFGTGPAAFGRLRLIAMKKLSGTIVSLVLGLLYLPAAYAQDAREILRKSSEVYATLRTYQFDGASRMNVEFDGESYHLNLNLEMARGETADVPWAVAFSNPGFEKPSGPSPAKYPFISMVFPYDFARFAGKVKSAQLLREEPLEINGKSTSCYVIEVLHFANASTDGATRPPETVWIDKTNFLVLKVAFQTTQRATGTQPALQLNWITTFTSYKLNGDPPEWLVNQKADNERRVEAQRVRSVGTQAPDFKLQDLNGREVHLSDLRGKVILLGFWATWCAPCRAEFPLLAKLERDWTAKGLVVIRITDEAAIDVRSFQKSTGQNFQTLVDGASVFHQYGVNGRPTLIVVDKTGTISSYEEAALTEARVVERIKKAGL